MDFGDHEVEAIHDVVNGSLFKHRYAATGEYNVSGKSKFGFIFDVLKSS